MPQQPNDYNDLSIFSGSSNNYDDLSIFDEPKKSGFWQGLMDVPEELYGQVNKAGKSAFEHIKGGNYPAAFHDITEPITSSFEGLTQAAINAYRGKPLVDVPQDPSEARMTGATQALGMVGLPSQGFKEAWEASDYPRLAGQAAGAAATMGLFHKAGEFSLPKGESRTGSPTQLDLPITDLRTPAPKQGHLPGLEPPSSGPIYGPHDISPYGLPNKDQARLPLEPPTDASGQGMLFDTSSTPIRGESPVIPPPRPAASVPEQQELPLVVTIKAPEAGTLELLRNQGYVPVPGMRSSEGYPQWVRADVAPMYAAEVQGKKVEPPLNAFEQAMRAKVPGAIPEGQIAASDTVQVPRAKVNETYIANMEEGGYKLTGQDETNYTFTRVDEGPQFQTSGGERPPMSPEDTHAHLTRMLGREPTEQEMQWALERQVKPGEQTGRVAEFPQPVFDEQGNRASPVTGKAFSTDELLQYLNSDAVQRNPNLVRQIENELRTRGVAPNPENAPLIGSAGTPYKGWDWKSSPTGNVAPFEGAIRPPGAPRPNELPPNVEVPLPEIPPELTEPQPIDIHELARNEMGEAIPGVDRPGPPIQQPQLFPMEVGRQAPSGDIAGIRSQQVLRQPEQLSMEGMMNPTEEGPSFEQVKTRHQREVDQLLSEARALGLNPDNYSSLGELAHAVDQRMQGDVSGTKRLSEDPFEGPMHAKVEGGGLKASFNVERGIENLMKDYSSPLSGIMMREGMQNALDAADKMGNKGEVRVRTNNDKDGAHTIEIHDNGPGMDEGTLANKLVEVFSSGKEGDPNATGGKGLGSASYIYGGKHFEIKSVAFDLSNVVDKDGNIIRLPDGKKYRIKASGTKADFLLRPEGSDYVRVRVPDSTPTETTMKVTMGEGQDSYDSRNMLEKIIEHSRNRPSKVIVDTYSTRSSGKPLSELKANPEITKGFKSHVDDKLVADSTYKNNEVKVLVPEFDPNAERNFINIQFLNNGMYQFSETMSLGEKIKNVPKHVLVDIHPLVDEMHTDYPFTNTREHMKNDIKEYIDKVIKERITGPAVESKKNRVQELYNSMTHVDAPGLARKAVIFDPGNRLTPEEMQKFSSHPTVQALVEHYDGLINDILLASGNMEWQDRLEGIGLVLDPNMHGVHIPNPATGKSTILINPFERMHLTPADNAFKGTITNLHEVAHVGKESGSPIQLLPDDLTDPRIGEFLQSYINQLIDHGDVGMFTNTGHGMDFAHRLGEVYATYGAKRTFAAADKLESILTGGNKSGGYSPELQELLHIYTERQGRTPTTEDLLSGTGVKQRNKRFGAEGDIPSNSETNGDGTSAWGKVKQTTGWGQGATKGGRQNPNEFNFIKEALAVPSALTTTGDLSAPGRQGLSMIGTPQFWKAAGAMFKGLSPEGFKQIDAELHSKPIMQRKIDLETGKVGKSIAQEIGLKTFRPASEAGPRAEATASRWLETGGSIPYLSAAYRNTLGVPVRATNRAYITFLNHLSVNRTEFLMNKARDMAIEALDTGSARSGIFKQKFSPNEAQNLNPYHNMVLGKEIADFVNTATGHGPLRTHVLPFKQAEVSLEGASSVLSSVLFSPGLIASRIRMLNPSTYVMASPFVRKQYIKAALSTAAAWYAFTELAKQADPDAQVSNDITSADFGKVRIGDTRLDPGGGFLQFLTAYGRAYAGGSTSSSTGQFHKFGAGYQAQTQEDMMERFFVNKLNPVAKFAYDVASASQYNPFHVGDRTMQMFVPLLGQDLLELYKEDPSLVPWMGPAAAVGMGTQIYSKGESVGKLIPPENDWLVQGGGGIRSLMPWNWGEEQQ